MKQVVVVGTGGHAKVVADIIIKSNDSICGFLDDINKENNFLGYPILGKVSDYKKFLDSYFIIAIGDSYLREKFSNSMQNVNWYTAIHPNASISSIGTKLDFGTVVMPNAVINSGAIIGKHCIINSSSNVEHDNKIGNFSHVSVGAKLAGRVILGRHVWVGIGAVVSSNINICDNSTVGAGATVVDNITKKGVYIGTPAKFIHE